MFLHILFILFIALLLLWLYWYLYFWSRLRVYPGKWPIPIIGNILHLKDVNKDLFILNRFMSHYKTKVFRLHAVTHALLIIQDEKLLECLLSSQKLIDKSGIYRFLRPWLNDGLLTSTGEKWQKRRKMLTPSFHFQILEQFIEVFDKQSTIMVQKMQKDLGQSSMDIYKYVNLCTLDVICETAMGTEVNAQQNEDSVYVSSVKKMCKIILERTLNLQLMIQISYVFTSTYREQCRALEVLHGYTDSVIKRRRDELLNTRSNEQIVVKKRRIAFLDMLLQATIDGQPLSNEDIREEVDTFMFEGHDTVTSAISFALYNLAQNPEIQEKVVRELQQIFGSKRDRPLTYDDLTKMRYLEMVVKESLRLYPSVPIFFRELCEDTNFNGVTLPKGLDVGIFTFGLHRDPDYFPDPETFDPDRFLPDNQAKRSPFVYLPFSAGPRNCIGQKFALLEMKATLSKILRHYQLEPAVPAHKLQLIPETILMSSTGIFIKICERNWI